MILLNILEKNKRTKDKNAINMFFSGVVVLTVIQPEGKGKMKASDYINGLKENIIGKIVG